MSILTLGLTLVIVLFIYLLIKRKTNPYRLSPEDIRLINAIVKDDPGEVKKALKNGANPNTVDKNRMPAIIIASGKKQLSIVKYLISHDVNVDARASAVNKDFEGGTALLAASANGAFQIVNRLTNAGASVDMADFKGQTPLMSAAFTGNDKIVKLLIENKAEIDKKDNMGYTALMYACNGGKLQTAKTLIESGADVNAKDNNGVTALWFAKNQSFNNIVDLLLKNGANSK